jgi:hypothetical protein
MNPTNFIDPSILDPIELVIIVLEAPKVPVADAVD